MIWILETMQNFMRGRLVVFADFVGQAQDHGVWDEAGLSARSRRHHLGDGSRAFKCQPQPSALPLQSPGCLSGPVHSGMNPDQAKRMRRARDRRQGKPPARCCDPRHPGRAPEHTPAHPDGVPGCRENGIGMDIAEANICPGTANLQCLKCVRFMVTFSGAGMSGGQGPNRTVGCRRNAGDHDQAVQTPNAMLATSIHPARFCHLK